jgi:4-amino-4-deoxy-L-arabinose transferase-like glycosyltransferase
VLAIVLVAIRFQSADPDSALYADLSARMASGPSAAWIAPEWWGNWGFEGLFREHPIGVFMLPVLLAILGVPAQQAAYIVGVGMGLAALFLLAQFVRIGTSVQTGRWVLVLSQLTPVASLFRIRANHEYPMLVCLLLGLLGADLARKSWRWVWLLPAALCYGLLVKGAFILLVILGVGLWILLNPYRVRGNGTRLAVACTLALGSMLIVAIAYDWLYVRQTGESFWRGYWQNQLGPLRISTPIDHRSALEWHMGFYVLHLLWFSSPWTLLMLVAAWRHKNSIGSLVRSWPRGEMRLLVFAAGFTLLSIVALSPASRYAERYVFSAGVIISAAGAVISCREWPALGNALTRLDAAVPALPVVTWGLLMTARLALGPFLPRISQ